MKVEVSPEEFEILIIVLNLVVVRDLTEETPACRVILERLKWQQVFEMPVRSMLGEDALL